MKKIIMVVFFIAFLVIGLLFPTLKVNATTPNLKDQNFKKYETISGIYITKEKSGKKTTQEVMIMRRISDHQFVYCIEPGALISSSIYYNGSDSNHAVLANMTQAQWQRIMLLAYYGHGYEGHTANRWYAITQLLIWQTYTNGYDIYISDSSGNKITQYQSEIGELNTLVSNHIKVPDFNNSTYEVLLGDTLEIVDNNSMLDKFGVLSYSNNIEVSKTGNKLIIKPKTVGKGEIILQKSDTKYNIPPIVYTSLTHQNIMSVGTYDSISTNLNINISGSKINIEKLDSESETNVSQGEATLENAKYNVYANEDIYSSIGVLIYAKEDLVETLITDKDGKISSGPLPLGLYKILEIENPKGYLLDETEYTIETTKDNPYITLKIKEQVIKSEIQITKSFNQLETGILLPEENVIFEFYNSEGIFVNSIKTDKNGYAKLILPFGKYTVKQKTSLTTHEKVKDFEIIVDEYSNKIIFYNLVNKAYSARIKVVKVDKDTKETINSEAQFKIKNLNNGEYVKMTVTYPKTEIVEVFKTINGQFITPVPLIAGRYVLEEIKSPYGYIINSNNLEFTIDENSNFLEDEKKERYLEFIFENTEATGKLILKKYGEKLIKENSKYYYERIELSNIKFNLLADRDIIISGKKYFKNDVITSLITDESGYVEYNLPLGKYCIQETESDINHLLNHELLCFKIKYKDQYTHVVIKTLEIENFLPKGKMIFQKLDKQTGKPIPNTEITIYDEANNIIFVGLTDKNGYIILDDLPLGKFKLIETKSATGYLNSSEEIFFEIKENNQVVSVNLNNLTIKVPKTGITDSKVITYIGFAFILGGIIYVMYNKRKTN